MPLHVFLPRLNATLNGVSAVLLACALAAILTRRRVLHARLMLMALSSSAIFLVSYLVRVGMFGVHVFPDVGTTKTVYLWLLGTHTTCAIISLPLILRSVFLAHKARFMEHKKIARIAWPLWMYVSVTGVLVFWMLYVLAPRLVLGRA